MKRLSVTILALAMAAASGGIAVAGEADPQCVASAAHEMKFCKATCQEAFRVAKDLCRDISADCAEACRVGLETCLAVPLGQLATCRLGCSETLQAGVAACRELYAPETPERDQCVDAAQIAAFICRDNCREGVAEALRACRRSFRACILACPPPAN